MKAEIRYTVRDSGKIGLGVSFSYVLIFLWPVKVLSLKDLRLKREVATELRFTSISSVIYRKVKAEIRYTVRDSGKIGLGVSFSYVLIFLWPVKVLSLKDLRLKREVATELRFTSISSVID